MANEEDRQFLPLPFEKMNETDVREDVITPLLRRLQYKTGSENHIIREQFLRYPKVSLGRKDPTKDPDLRGKADYILEVARRLRWVIEAKAPKANIATDDIEQAYTYASHPEIRAIYFALCNGRELTIFHTSQGPNAQPLLSLSYEEFDGRFQELSNLLSPDAIMRDFPSVTIDLNPPIALGLRSLARITIGIIRYERSSLYHPILNELQITLTGGAVQRDDAGKLTAFLETNVPFRSLQQLNERLGLHKFEMVSDDSELSTDQNIPTVFGYQNMIHFPADEEVLSLLTWKMVKIPDNLACQISAKATGIYLDGQFSGTFESAYKFGPVPVIVLNGTFEISLA